MKVLGTQDGESLQIGKKVTAIQIQQKNCEAETLKVFRLLTSQVCFISSYLKVVSTIIIQDMISYKGG